jgi:glutamine synthetase
MICALIKAVDENADLLRSAVQGAGNDHRLGANEAPPAIISIFLGEQLTDVIEQIEAGGAKSSKAGGKIEIGVSQLPDLPRDATDRNRTSPFAFTGNKFEFRAVGSSQSCAGANIVMNTIVADALDFICAKLEAAEGDFNDALQDVLADIIKTHKRVLYNGDNYVEEWHAEAARRGLPNLRSTPEALEIMKSEKATTLFEKHGVLSARELQSRYEVYHETYETMIGIEASCALTIARTMIAPVAMAYQAELAETIEKVTAAGVSAGAAKSTLAAVCTETDKLCKSIADLEAVEEDSAKAIAIMSDMRAAVDELEGLVPYDAWPLPSYAEMLFVLQ